jgi:hypothetical protein
MACNMLITAMGPCNFGEKTITPGMIRPKGENAAHHSVLTATDIMVIHLYRTTGISGFACMCERAMMPLHRFFLLKFHNGGV